jgi:hypothetical protein
MLSVQVFLLLGLYSLPIDASGLGYVYLNLAIKVAVQNGMHRKVSRNVFDATTKEIRRCIWWTAYCMERCVIRQGDHGWPADNNGFLGRLAYIMGGYRRRPSGYCCKRVDQLRIRPIRFVRICSSYLSSRSLFAPNVSKLARKSILWGQTANALCSDRDCVSVQGLRFARS